MIKAGSAVLTDDSNPTSNPPDGWVLCDDFGDEDYAYSIAEGSGEENWSDDNSQITQTYYCNWDKRSLFMQDLLGQNLLMSGNRISRRTPDQHQEYGNFFAVDARVTGVAWTAATEEGLPQYKRAKVTTVYKQLPYWVRHDASITVNSVQLEYNRYTEKRYSYDSQFVTNNCGKQVNNEGGSKVNLRRPVASTLPTTELTLIWHKVPGRGDDPFEVPTNSLILAMQGSVNDREFFGYPTETVLFLGVDPDMTAPVADTDPLYEVPSTLWNIAYKFKVRNYPADGSERAGWNHTKECGTWKRVTFQNSTGVEYGLANLYDLWTIPL